MTVITAPADVTDSGCRRPIKKAIIYHPVLALMGFLKKPMLDAPSCGGNMTMTDVDFAKAVSGWKQAVALLTPMVDGLDFALKEIDRASKEYSGAFPKDTARAVKFAEAKSALSIGRLYLNSMQKSGAA